MALAIVINFMMYRRTESKHQGWSLLHCCCCYHYGLISSSVGGLSTCDAEEEVFRQFGQLDRDYYLCFLTHLCVGVP